MSLKTKDQVHVLYVDHKGHPAPLSSCFHATGTRRLSSSVERYPPATLTEIDSAYCPQSLSFSDVTTAAKEGYSPKAQQCPICFTALSLDLSEDGKSCFYNCGYCSWNSKSCGLIQPVKRESDGSISRVEMARSLEDLGRMLSDKREKAHQAVESHSRELTTAWEKRTKQQPKNQNLKDGPEGWSVEALEASLQGKKKQYSLDVPAEGIAVSVEHVSLDDEPAPTVLGESILTDTPQMSLEMSFLSQGFEQPQNLADLLPLPMPYRVRESRRCRAELEEGRPGILLKPKLNPLEGDSSLRSGHGQWWKKDSSAIHVMPRIGVMKHEVHGTFRVFLLKVTNPTLGPVRLRFTSSKYQGEVNSFKESSGKDMPTHNTTLANLLVDEIFEQYVDSVELQTGILNEMKQTESVELLSAEDSFIELGGKSREIPDAVQRWEFEESAASESAMRLVASSSSTAFFELALANASATASTSSSQLAVPLALEVETGNGSWESSLIPKRTKDDGDDKSADWVPFDLLITWK